jgi:hypothetical protein
MVNERQSNGDASGMVRAGIIGCARWPSRTRWLRDVAVVHEARGGRRRLDVRSDEREDLGVQAARTERRRRQCLR